MKTQMERLDVASGQSQSFTPDAVTLQDRGIWSGLKLEGWEGEPQEMSEAVLSSHAVIVNVMGGAIQGEMHWSGHRGVDTPLHQHHIGLVPAYLPYHAVSTSYSKSLILTLRPDYLDAIGGRTKIELRPTYGTEDGFLVSAALSLADDVREGSLMGAMYGETIQAALAAHLIRRYATKSVPKPQIDLSAKIRIREMILDQLQDELKLADLARAMQTDASTFARWFRKSYGMPPHQFILRERIARAKVMLRTSNNSLTDIAIQCGFNSHSHFATVFKRLVGTQPAKYRIAAS